VLRVSGHHQSDLTRRGRAVRSRMQPARAPITGQRRRRVLDRPGTYTADRHDIGVTARPARSSRSVPVPLPELGVASSPG